MCRGITHGWPSSRSTLSWGLQVHQCLLWRIHGCVIPGRSSTKGSVGPSGTCFSYAGVPPCCEGGAYAEESCSDGSARHPAGTAKTLGRRWWCTLNRHLVRSRFYKKPFPCHHRWTWNMWKNLSCHKTREILYFCCHRDELKFGREGEKKKINFDALYSKKYAFPSSFLFSSGSRQMFRSSKFSFLLDTKFGNESIIIRSNFESNFQIISNKRW